MPAPGKKHAEKKTKTSWKPGQSGNPAGTPKSPPEVRAFMKEGTLACAQNLMKIAQGDGEPRDIIAACRLVFDFTLAKPSAEGASAGALEVLDRLAKALTKKDTDDV